MGLLETWLQTPPLVWLYNLWVPLGLSLSISRSHFLSFSHYIVCVYIYIYMRCEVIIWAKFGHFRCYYLGQVGVIIWAKLFVAYKNSGFKRFLAHTVIILCFFCAQLSGSYLKIAFFKKGAKIGFFKFLCFKLIFGKFSVLGLLKLYKNRGFSRFLCFLFLKEKKGKKSDNWNFWFFFVQKWPFRDA